MSRHVKHAGINRLVALFNAGCYVEVERKTRALVKRHPSSGFAWKALGACLNAQGKEGLLALRKAVELLPGDAEAHCNLGTGLTRIGRLNDAAANYRRALAIKPDFTAAYSSLALSLNDLGQPDVALESCRRGLEVTPGDADAHNNLGNVLKGLRRPNDALVSYQRALAIRPDLVEAQSNLGNTLKDLLRLEDALTCHRRALQIRPGFAELHSNLGVVQKAMGRFVDAAASYSHALEIKPNQAEVYSNLGLALTELGRPDYAVRSYRRALHLEPDYAKVLSNMLFTLSYLSDYPAEMSVAEARHFDSLVTKRARPYCSWNNTPEEARCLRIGWVSGDFRRHSVGHFVEAIMAALATEASDRLQLYAYSNNLNDDSLTERIKACCVAWRSAIGLSDEGLAKQIRDDSIDILIDLSGHSDGNRLPMFAWKPAPVQVSWLGYLGTTGVAAIDYLLADLWALPVSEERYFSEKVWRLPESYLCFTRADPEIAVSELPAIANGYVTFGSFNNLTKMNDAVVTLWARVLAAVPGSRLLLKAKQLDEIAVAQRTVERFEAHGIDPGRLSLEGSVPTQSEHLATHWQIDIALDPFPYPGITTSVEALWMGIPVLTLAGEHFLSRQGVSIMMNAGLPDWIAINPDDYVTRAADHACDLERLSRLRRGLRQRVVKSPLLDAPRFAHCLEAALRDMWAHWCAQQQS